MLAAVALLHVAAAYADDFTILYHERPGAWSVGPDTTPKSSAVQSLKPSDDSTLSFTAFGRQFRARLEPNDLLLRGLSFEARSSVSGIEVFAGELVDAPGSWVRLTRSGRDITGVIFDGAELFAIDSAARLAPHLKSPEPSPYTGPIVYRWRDTTGTLIDELGGLVAAASMERPTALAAAADLLDPGRRVDLGLVADQEFSARAGPSAASAVVSRANFLDGILVFELGLHVNVAELVLFSQTDPFTAAEPQALLAELEEYRATTPAQAAQDLTHLLTGRSFSTNIVGVANIASVCDARLGVGLTESTTNGAFRDALIMAHEIGHNFGAPHDGVPGPCLSTPPSYIMAPEFKDTNQQFSQCSIEQMQALLTSACIDVLAPADVELRTVSAPTDAIVGEFFSVFVTIDNPSPADVYGVELTAEGTNLKDVGLSTGTPGFVCSAQQTSTARCRKTALPSGESVQFQVYAGTISATPATLRVAVRALGDPDTTDNEATYTFAVRPIVDLAVDIAPGPDYLRVRDEADYTATVRNTGTTTATNARVVVGISQPVLSVVSLSTGAGACTLNPSQQYLCPLGDLAPGGISSISLRVRAANAVSTELPGRYELGGISFDAAADQPNYGYGGANKLIAVANALVDLQATASPTQQLVLGAPAEFTHTVVNAGPDIATDVVLSTNTGVGEQGVMDAVITSNVGTCEVINQSAMRFDCRVPTLAVGEALVATVRGTASRLGTYGSANRAEVNAYDPSNANNTSGAGYTVVTAVVAQPPAPSPPATPPPPPPSGGNSSAPAAAGGGGGGATEPLFLVLLTVVLAARRVASAGPRLMGSNDSGALRARKPPPGRRRISGGSSCFR